MNHAASDFYTSVLIASRDAANVHKTNTCRRVGRSSTLKKACFQKPFGYLHMHTAPYCTKIRPMWGGKKRKVKRKKNVFSVFVLPLLPIAL